jgi:hypothetical protein
MFRATLKLEALCETCPEIHVDTERGDSAFGLSNDPQTYVDFLYELQFIHGWEVVEESYVYFKHYCPKCKENRAAVAA